MSLENLLKNSYFYLFLGCMATLGSLGITLFMAEQANSQPWAEDYSAISQNVAR